MIEQEFTVSSNDLSSNIIEYLSNVEPKEPLSTIAIVKDASGSKSYKVLVHGMYYYFDAKEAFVKKLKQ